MHGIASVAPLERWCREYRAGGPEALGPRPKGRPRGSKSKPKPEPTREQELAVYGQINVYSVTTKSERYERSYWTRTAAGNGIGGRKAPVPYGS